MSKNYDDFLQKKTKGFDYAGFDIEESQLNPMLFDFQKFAVKLALKKGCYALFEDCGMGKTIQMFEYAKQVIIKENAAVLVLAPLNVISQHIEKGREFGYEVCRYFQYDQMKLIPNIYITNYEQIENIPIEVLNQLIGVVLDESSILKNFAGKTKTKIVDTFRHTKYKLACTATPSPNDHLELGNHAEFLNVMPSNEMIARFFINDTMHFGTYRLKKHAENEFWEWVSSWAMCISNPADIGFRETGKRYVLPQFEVNEINIDAGFDEKEYYEGEQMNLIESGKTNATGLQRELKRTMEARLNKVKDIAQYHLTKGEQVCIVVKRNDEADYLKKILKCVEVRGSKNQKEAQDNANNLLKFANNEIDCLLSKKEIIAFGLNFQNCHIAINASPDFGFESDYQFLKRFHRFGQKNKVTYYVVTTPSMENVRKVLIKKEKQFREMQEQMSNAVSNTYLQNQAKKELKKDFKHIIKKGEGWEMHNGDCVEVIQTIPSNSIDFSVFSPPFANLYIYSDSIRDMGNCANDDEFFEHFEFLAKEIHRILRPDRLVAIHCKNLVNYMNSNGKSGQRDFRGGIIRLFERVGFSFHSDTTIWKDPVIEMQRTKAHGLLYKQLRKDSSFSRTGMAEFVVVFRKWSDATNEHLKVPISWKTQDNFPLDKWQKYASPVINSEMTKEDLLEVIYQQSQLLDLLELPPHLRNTEKTLMDIQQTNVLNIRQAKDNKDEKHICPLQLDLIEWAVEMWSNPNEVVFSPFAGIGSEGYQSLKMKRKFIGIELKPEYFEIACRNLKSALEETKQISLF